MVTVGVNVLGLAFVWLEAVRQGFTDGDGSARGHHERIPLGVALEVDEDLPHHLRRGFDVDLGVQAVLHRVLPVDATLDASTSMTDHHP